MQVKKSLVAVVAATSIGLAGIGGMSVASAAADTSGDSLVAKIAQKFNLKQDEVQAVFDADKSAHAAERHAAFSDRLQAAVDDGKITAAQKTLIENKITEVMKAHEAERTSLDTWAKDQGIDAKYLLFGKGPGSEAADRLQAAVDAGKITAAQKTAIEQKQAELENAREAARSALTQWAKDNGISSQYLMMGGMRGGPGGHERRF